MSENPRTNSNPEVTAAPRSQSPKPRTGRGTASPPPSGKPQARTGGWWALSPDAEGVGHFVALYPLSPPVQRSHSHRIVSVFANVTRTGWWRAEGTISPTALFGDVELDLRQATVPTGQVEIKAVAPFGDIEVIVPDGFTVELTGFSVFGRKKVDVRRPAPIESAPVVRVQAVTEFGSVLVRS